MQRYKLTIEFDGRGYVGMQAQSSGPTIQAALEAAIDGYCQTDVRIAAAGRTDAGVHAKAMVVHCDLPRGDAPDKVMAALNAHLRPHPIAVLKAQAVSDQFHARFDCTRRRYGYRIVTRRAPLTFDKGLAWRLAFPLDLPAMQRAARCLIGKHDFTTFRHVHCQAKSPIKTLETLDVVADREGLWINAAARSFLHSQVRSMVGCLSLVGRGKWQPEDVKRALEAKDRSALGFNAPPDGLYFMGADYPASLQSR
ncbi:MAG: tRNA pseudouridine(38-40) synthase TruA [Pseudomonadota bacterium]